MLTDGLIDTAGDARNETYLPSATRICAPMSHFFCAAHRRDAYATSRIRMRKTAQANVSEGNRPAGLPLEQQAGTRNQGAVFLRKPFLT
jgi:hypothetical protein